MKEITHLMVQLADNTYDVVEAANGKPKLTKSRKVTHYANGKRMPAGVSARLSGQHVVLVGSRVQVSPGDIVRIVGPLDCDEAVRIRARAYTQNWLDNQFVESAPADDLRAALANPTEPLVHAAMCAIRDSK